MRSFCLPGIDFVSGSRVALPGELKKHIEKVLRLKPGARIHLFDGTGRYAEAVLLADAQVELGTVAEQPAPPCRITLIQGIPKGDKLELILQKGTELGVSHFVLVPMERSVGRIADNRREERLERWGKIIQEAARQCHQYHLPQLDLPSSFSTTLADAEGDEKLFLWEESQAALAGGFAAAQPRSVVVVVGPEGGMSAAEATLAETHGFRSVSLGPRILRTETAGLAIVAILQYLYGDMAGV
ncbi:MAG: 16S rRNA (uracil(1498)-N(3))-methyltransferase [Desulfuromonas sp.]|nr:MAG: 16S rRNA (uracil(1498)-N(3))-methyltransferase [Desulfuromonas sp.]